MGDKSTDSGVLDTIGQHDILIAVVGDPGVGKSTFINKAAAVDTLPIDQASKPDNEVQYVVCPKPDLYQDQKVVFLDVPAFDSESNEQVIQSKLRNWLRVVTSKRLKISGILYLHRMTEAEFSGALLMHLTSLVTLCKETGQGPSAVMLVLTTQALPPRPTRSQRKIQNKWNTVFPQGVPQSTRFENSSNSAWEIVEALTTHLNDPAKQSGPLHPTDPSTGSASVQPTAARPRKFLGRREMILSGVVPIPLPFPLAAVRAIDDFSQVQYPEGIISPNPQLNSNVENGKFRYDREFLMQFMPICKEKPITLPPLDAIGLEPIDQNSLAMSCASHGRHRQPSGTSAHIGLGYSTPSGFVNSAGLNPFAGGGGMSNFNVMRGSKLTGKERSPLSLEGPAGILSNRTRSQRGKRHGGEVSTQRAAAVHAAPLANPKPVVPLKVTEDSLGREAAQLGAGSRKLAGREVGDLLNELTTERFDSISDRIIERVNKSEGERDGRTLILVIRLVFERATDGVGWSKICARLCRKMMDRINNNVRNDRIRNSKGKPMAGGQLFQNYLLKKYREDFERGWLSGGATTAPVTTKATEGGATKAANEKNEGGGEEVVLYSTEYYAAQKARQQDLGLIRFVGELFKLQVIAKHIVLYECAKKLLVKANNPDEKKIEGLCQLLTTVGSLLDTRNARARMDAYFQRMRELAKSPKVSPRMQSMLQDVIELREQEWIVGNEFVEAPSMIYQTHETAVDLSNLVIAEAPIMLGPGSESATGSKAGDGREPLVQTSSSSKISFVPRNAEPGAKEIMSVHPQFGRKKPPPRAKRIEQTEMQQQEWE